MRNIPTERLLQYEISKKPHLKDISDRLADISIDELQAMSFPLPWIRAAFIAEKHSLLARLAADRVTAHMSHTTLADLQGTLILWQGDETFLKMNSSHISIKPNRYLFCPDDGGIFNDNIFSRTIDPRVYREGRPMGPTTLTQYKKANQEARNKDCPMNAPVIDLTNDGKSPSQGNPLMAQYGVRFG